MHIKMTTTFLRSSLLLSASADVGKVVGLKIKMESQDEEWSPDGSEGELFYRLTCQVSTSPLHQELWRKFQAWEKRQRIPQREALEPYFEDLDKTVNELADMAIQRIQPAGDLIELEPNLKFAPITEFLQRQNIDKGKTLTVYASAGAVNDNTRNYLWSIAPRCKLSNGQLMFPQPMSPKMSGHLPIPGDILKHSVEEHLKWDIIVDEYLPPGTMKAKDYEHVRQILNPDGGMFIQSWQFLGYEQMVEKGKANISIFRNSPLYLQATEGMAVYKIQDSDVKKMKMEESDSDNKKQADPVARKDIEALKKHIKDHKCKTVDDLKNVWIYEESDEEFEKLAGVAFQELVTKKQVKNVLVLGATSDSVQSLKVIKQFLIPAELSSFDKQKDAEMFAFDPFDPNDRSKDHGVIRKSLRQALCERTKQVEDSNTIYNIVYTGLDVWNSTTLADQPQNDHYDCEMACFNRRLFDLDTPTHTHIV